MSSAGFDIAELITLTECFDNIEKQYPKDGKDFLRQQGNTLNRQTKKLAKKRVGKNGKGPDKDKPANKRYVNGFKRGKVYHHEQTNSLAVRVYNTRPHAHLIEYGHVQLTHDRKSPKNGERFVKGFHVLRDSANAFEPKFEEEVEEFFDNLLDKGLSL